MEILQTVQLYKCQTTWKFTPILYMHIYMHFTKQIQNKATTVK